MKHETNKSGSTISLDVKFIKNKYSIILRKDGIIIDRMACENKLDIGFVCRELLRWYNKMGGISDWSISARRKQNESSEPIGKIFYRKDLEKS